MFPKTYWMEAGRIILNAIAAFTALWFCRAQDLGDVVFYTIFVMLLVIAALTRGYTDDIASGKTGTTKYWATCSPSVPAYEMISSLLAALNFAVLMSTPFPSLGFMGLLLFMCNGIMTAFAFWAICAGLRRRKRMLQHTI